MCLNVNATSRDFLVWGPPASWLIDLELPWTLDLLPHD
jgi:hypothetical protein